MPILLQGNIAANVELGKTLAVGVEAALTGGALPPDADCSTVGLIEAIRAMRAA